MAQLYNYLAPSTASATDLEVTTPEINQLKQATNHQISFGGGSATTGTLALYAKYLGSADYEAVTINGAAASIDITAPTTLQFTGWVDSLKIDPDSLDGTYRISFVGGIDESIDNSVDIANLEKAVSGFVIVDMSSADRQLTEAESLNKTIIVLNPGDGTKTLTLYDSAANPGEYTFLNYASFVPFSVACATGSPVPVFKRSRVGYGYGSGLLDLEPSQTVSADGVEVTTAANTDEQTLKTLVLPANTLANNGDRITIKGFVSKSGVATNETLKIYAGPLGTVADPAVFTNTTMATTNDFCSFSVDLMRYSATLLRVTSISNAASPYGGSTSATSDVTVANMGTTHNHILFTGDNSTGAETVTVKGFSAELRR